MDIFHVCKTSLCEYVIMQERKYSYAFNMYAAAAEILLSREQIE